MLVSRSGCVSACTPANPPGPCTCHDLQHAAGAGAGRHGPVRYLPRAAPGISPFQRLGPVQGQRQAPGGRFSSLSETAPSTMVLFRDGPPAADRIGPRARGGGGELADDLLDDVVPPSPRADQLAVFVDHQAPALLPVLLEHLQLLQQRRGRSVCNTAPSAARGSLRGSAGPPDSTARSLRTCSMPSGPADVAFVDHQLVVIAGTSADRAAPRSAARCPPLRWLARGAITSSNGQLLQVETRSAAGCGACRGLKLPLSSTAVRISSGRQQARRARAEPPESGTAAGSARTNRFGEPGHRRRQPGQELQDPAWTAAPRGLRIGGADHLGRGPRRNTTIANAISAVAIARFQWPSPKYSSVKSREKGP